MNPTLFEIFKGDHEKISDKWSSYLQFYQKHLAPRQNDQISLLEIGIQNGGSLEVWAKFFPHAEIIVGCDINPLCSKLKYEDPRVRVFVHDAGTQEARTEIIKASPKFDFVIDDGSHRSDDIVRAFSLYFPMLEPGGLYIVEDLHSSYYQEYYGGVEAPYSALNFFKRLTDYVNLEHWGADVPPNSLLSFFEDYWSVSFESSSLGSITEVVFCNSLVLIRKGNAEDNTLGPRMITGTSALVDDRVAKLDKSERLKKNESQNPFGPLGMRLEAYPDEVTRLRDVMQNTTQALVSTTEQVSMLTEELREKNEALDAATKKQRARIAQFEQLRNEKVAQDQIVAIYQKQVRAIAAELTEARRKPVKQLGKLLQYKALRRLSKLRSVISEKAAARFARSAAKRHPSRLPQLPEVAVLPVSTHGVAAGNDIEILAETSLNAANLSLIADSGFWDERWYKDRHWKEIRTAAKCDKRIISPLHHYVTEGWKCGYEPSPFFPMKRLADLSEEPIMHFLEHSQYDGYQFEENAWFPSAQEIERYSALTVRRKAKRVIYTCIVSQYDDLMQPKYIDLSSDYVCFTDNQQLVELKHIGVWRILPLVQTLSNPGLTNRWHKMHPHALFPQYEESLYIDGNVNVLSPFLFETISERRSELLLPQHFLRSCISEELAILAGTGRISKFEARALENLIQLGRSEGFPTGWGLSENNVIFRKHHQVKIRSLMEEWWVMTEAVAQRDQGHFCYLLWKHGFSFQEVTFQNCRNLFRDFAIVRHNTKEEIQLRGVISRRLSPAFDQAGVTIVLSCNETFINYLDVLLTSIVDNCSKDRNYDIIVMNQDLTVASREAIQEAHGRRENVSVRFYDMTHVLATFSDMNLHLEGYVPIETYNKIFLNEILEGYEKVVYIDTDLIVDRDIADLFDLDLCGRSIGAARNVANIHAARSGIQVKGRDFRAYLRTELGILNVDQYFQAGVLLLDLTHRNTQRLFRKCIEKINEVRKPAFFDQCIFNSIFYGDVFYFSTEWNTVWYLQNYSYVRSNVADDLFFDYARARNKPSIVHFASGDKPTNKIDWRLGDYFWKYALRSRSRDHLLKALSHEQRISPQIVGAVAELEVIPEMIRILVHVHLYYEDQLPFIMKAIASLGDFSRDVYFTIQKGSKINTPAIAEAEPGCKFIEVPNLGYDLCPFIDVLRRTDLSKYDYILKLHTKAPRTEEQGSVYGINVPDYAWRDALVESLVGTPETFHANITRLQKDRTIGALGCKDFIFSTFENNEEVTYDLPKWRSYLDVQSGSRYVGGTIFLARAFPFERFRKLFNQPELFESSQMCTRSHKNFAHVVERLCGIVVENEGMTIQGVQ